MGETLPPESETVAKSPFHFVRVSGQVLHQSSLSCTGVYAVPLVRLKFEAGEQVHTSPAAFTPHIPVKHVTPNLQHSCRLWPGTVMRCSRAYATHPGRWDLAKGNVNKRSFSGRIALYVSSVSSQPYTINGFGDITATCRARGCEGFKK